MPQKTIKNAIFLVIKNSIIRSGLQTSLSKAAGIKIVGEAIDKSDAEKSIRALCPNIILLECKKNENLEELKKWINKVCMEVKVLILLSDNTGPFLSAIIEAGAVGFLNSEDSVEVLANAIQRAAQGEVILSQEQMRIVRQWKDNVGIKLTQLTARETEILKLLAKGLDSKTISSLLDIGTKTVAYHITNILSKLSLKSRQEAAIWALKHLSDDLE